MTRLLLLGAGGPATHNLVTSLNTWTSNIWTLGADTNPYHLHLANTNHTTLLDTTPDDPYHDEEISYLVEHHQIDYVWAQPDEETLYLSTANHPTLLMPSAGVVATSQDKHHTARLLGNDSWLLDIDHAELTYPLWMRARRGAGSTAAIRVDHHNDILAWLHTWKKRGLTAEDFHLQPYLPGRDYSYTSVWHNGTCIAEAARERVQYANTRGPSGQSSSPSVARLYIDKSFYDFCRAEIIRFCAHTDDSTPNGVFYLDTKTNTTGVPVVTEINAGRFNTTINFYTEAGVNQPGILLNATQNILPPQTQRPDVVGDDWYWIRQPDMGHRLVRSTSEIPV